jgi:hypothetical protein
LLTVIDHHQVAFIKHRLGNNHLAVIGGQHWRS